MLPPYGMLTTKNWRALLASLGPALILVAAITGCTPPGPRALLEGERLIRAGKYTEAVESLQEATRLLPSNAQAWNHLGLAYHKAGQPHNALKAYEQARRCDLHLTPVRYNLGCLLLEQNNFQPAIAELTAYTLLEQDSADGWFKLATAQFRARQWDAAERSYNKALQLRPALPQAWNNLGMIHAQRKRSKDALSCFNAAIQKQPTYAPAVLNSAIVYQHQVKNNALAMQKYEEYLRLKPDARDAELVKRIVRYLKTPPVAPREEPAVAAVTNRQDSSLPSGTREVVTAAGRGEPQTSSAPPMPASTAQRQEGVQQPAAPSQPSTIVRATPTPEPRRESQAAAELPSQPRPAGSTLVTPAPEQTVVVLPKPSEPSRREQQAQPKPAGEAAESTAPAPVQPRDPDVIQLSEDPPVKLADDRPPSIPLPEPQTPRVTPPARQQATPAPGTHSETIVRAEPPPQESRSFLDRINPASWFKPRRQSPPSPTPLDALPETRMAAASDSTDSATTTRAATVEQSSWSNIPRYGYRSLQPPAGGDRFKAQGSFTQAVEAHRDQRLAEAISNYQQAIEADPGFFEARYNLGLAAYESKDWALSLSAYETALSINPTSANCRYNFALALQQAGFYLDAADELEKLLAQNAGEVRAHLTLASLYADELGKPLLARPHYLKVLELDPRHGQAPAIRYWLAANP